MSERLLDVASLLSPADHRAEWKTPPTLKTCVDECGSKCCRTPTTRLYLRQKEMLVLKKRARELGVKFKVHHHSNDTQGNLWAFDFSFQGREDMACSFLADDGTCRVYEDRPRACRSFPHRPFKGCLVWPGTDESPKVGA